MFEDIVQAWPIIAVSVGIVFVLGCVYMLFTRMFAGLIIWSCIVLYFIALILLGYFLYDESVTK